jgi:deoxyribodipyrimidine photo-lyase
MKGIMYFRSDLRMHDNTALYHASKVCTDGLLAVYYIPTKTLKSHHVSGNKLAFILAHLKLLQTDLNQRNINLQVRQVATFNDCVDDIMQLMEYHHCDALFFNKEYEWDELQRDAALLATAKAAGKKVETFDDQLVFAAGEILTPKHKTYSVFTPFKKAWLTKLSRLTDIKTYGLPARQSKKLGKNSPIPLEVPGFAGNIDLTIWPAGEKAAQKRLKHFVANKLQKYEKDRDYPAIDGTSRLSPYLAIGIISTRQCISLLENKNNSWLDELIWREFYKHVSYNFPHVCKGHAFKQTYDALSWQNNKNWQQAWFQGKTGFPIVDAAMRQLQQTGWMHNRLRMITAMFFSKLIDQDWRIGEAYFMKNLIDGDFSANNGGWQWSASTGTDAAPYFRIFNPWRQSETFDPEGNFIKQYCPELKEFSRKAVHNPYVFEPELAEKSGYPQPILDYKVCREAAIKKFKDFNAKHKK